MRSLRVPARPAVRVLVFGLGLGVVFALALGTGRMVGPLAAAGSEPAEHGATAGHDTGHADDHGHAGDPDAADGPKGLAVSQDGYTLSPTTRAIPAGRTVTYTFSVTRPDGAPLRAYTPTHEKELHLIVARRDLSGYQHLHPTRSPGGVWSVPLRLAEAGAYRVFADFAPSDRPDRPLTLGVDLTATGPPAAVRTLPPPRPSAEVDGYTVRLDGRLVAGRPSPVTVEVSHAGRPVTDLQPYLGAYGHLVALREGDLGYLHVHPVGQPDDGLTPAGPRVGFVVEVPTAGTYRLYLDFRHREQVRTAEFTVVVPAEPR